MYVFSDEEGTRSGTAYLGSVARAGGLDEESPARRDVDGTTMGDALRAYGRDPGALASARRDANGLIGYAMPTSNKEPRCLSGLAPRSAWWW